ncbi:MAG: hypothetical protein GY749_10570 [Desulfobacteraceae bacterium]|nr:hypothetical protein [Desulfobacteraceae bacterium]
MISFSPGLISWTGEHFYTWVKSHTSKAGADATSSSADIPVGNTGSISSVDSTMTWLTPFALKTILAHAKAAYLNGHLDKVEAVLEEYVQLVNTYSQLEEWNNLSSTEKFEFTQMKNEMKILLHRIANNMDYFANHAGWIPMLSFEVTKAAFENEIERGIRVLYLAYWLGNKATTLQDKINAFSIARNELKGQMIYFQNRYMDITENQIPGLETDAADISNDIVYLQSELVILEQKLRREAEDKFREPFWKQAAGVLGVICNLCPIGQPVLGAIGSGIAAISKYDPNASLETNMNKIGNVWNELDKISLKKVTDSWNVMDKEIREFDINKIKTDSKYFKNFMDGVNSANEAFNEKVNIITEPFKMTKAPKDKIEAELERLKANSPEFQNLASEIKELNLQKEQFALDLDKAIQEVTTLSNGIIHNSLAIDGLNHDISEGNAAIDQRAVMYLREMERRAKHRLLKYHYYMKKAYEYRLLEPYPGELNLELLFEKFKTLAGAGGGELTPDEFDALKALYEEQLSTVTDIILEKYISNPPELSAPVRFELTQDKLDKLNAGETTVINLVDMGLFQPFEENIRIVEFKVYDIEAELKTRSYAYLDLYMEHSGISKLSRKGENYLFRHYNRNTENPIVWGARYDYKYNIIDPIEPSLASESLLRHLLGDRGTTDNLIIYSRPAAWADILITSTVKSDIGNLAIKSLEVRYDFMIKPEDIKRLEILTSDASASYIIIDKQDRNNRQDGMGQFRRTYDKHETVTLTALEKYGALVFEKWTDRAGNDLGTDLVLTLDMDDDKAVIPLYKSPCQYTISPSDGLFDYPGGTGTISINTTESDCTWNITNNDNWITIESGSSGIGNGTVNYSIAENTGNSSRSGTILIEDKIFTVNQKFCDTSDSKAAAALDMNISTRNYDDTVSNTDIESTISVAENGDVWIAVVVQETADLDTYQVEVSFDPTTLEFIEGAEENAFEGINGFLKKNGGQTVGFQAVETDYGKINISNALVSSDCDIAPDGSGIIALLRFRVLDNVSDNQLVMSNVFFVNCNSEQENITVLTPGYFNSCASWDFNCDGIVNYLDLGTFADHWLLTCEDSDKWNNVYDLNSDCIVNYLDLGIFADHWLEETK